MCTFNFPKMLHLSLISVLLTFVISLKRQDNNPREPFGPRMCEELCEQLRLSFDETYLICYVFNVTEDNSVNQDDTYNPTAKITKNRRQIQLRQGKKVTDGRNVNGTKERDRKKVNYNKPLPENTFKNIPTDYINQGCTILSAAHSKRYTTFMYLLLKCHVMKYCYQTLNFVNLITESFLNNTLYLCGEHGRQDTQRQIFMGPCVIKATSNCLYLISSVIRVSITTYQEPQYTSSNVKKELMNRKKRHAFDGKSFVCANFKKEGLVCLQAGSQLYLVYLKPHSLYMQLKRLKWKIEGFSGLTDFKLDDIQYGYEAFMVGKSTIRRVFFKFGNKTISNFATIHTKAVSIIVRNSNTMFIYKRLDKPFCKCQTFVMEVCNDS